MLQMTCDICQKPAGCWEFRKKHRVFKKWFNIENEVMESNFDVCDNCIREIKIKLKPRSKEDTCQ